MHNQYHNVINELICKLIYSQSLWKISFCLGFIKNKLKSFNTNNRVFNLIWWVTLVKALLAMEKKCVFPNLRLLWSFIFTSLCRLGMCQINLEFQVVESLQNVRFNSFLGDSHNVHSLAFCAMHCLDNDVCRSFSYKDDAQRCCTHDARFTSAASGESEQGWRYFTSKLISFNRKFWTFNVLFALKSRFYKSKYISSQLCVTATLLHTILRACVRHKSS